MPAIGHCGAAHQQVSRLGDAVDARRRDAAVRSWQAAHGDPGSGPDVSKLRLLDGARHDALASHLDHLVRYRLDRADDLMANGDSFG